MIERLRKQQMKYSPVAPRRGERRQGHHRFPGQDRRRASSPAARARTSPIVLGEGRMLPQLEQGLIGAAAGEHRDIERRFSRRLPRHGTRRQARDLQHRDQDGRGTDAARSRRRVLRGLRRHRGRCREAARGRGGQHAPRARAESAHPQQDGGDGEALPGQSDRRAERPGRVADPRHADRGDAPRRHQGRVAGAAARAARRTRAAPRRARPDDQRRHPPREHRARSGSARTRGWTKWWARTAMPRR